MKKDVLVKTAYVEQICKVKTPCAKYDILLKTTYEQRCSCKDDLCETKMFLQKQIVLVKQRCSCKDDLCGTQLLF
jgi:hypothetical protein